MLQRPQCAADVRAAADPVAGEVMDVVAGAMTDAVDTTTSETAGVTTEVL